MAERQGRTTTDTLLTRIGQVVMLHHGGDREEARRRLLDLWTEIGEEGDPLHRCTLAHYLADTQDDPSDELAWDLRALTAAQEHDGSAGRDQSGSVGECGQPEREHRGPWEEPQGAAQDQGSAARDQGSAEARALFPSLHLNLAADYVKLGRADAARTHVRRARRAADALGEDSYGDGVRAAISRMELRLGEGEWRGER
ncbi:hypothetical protein GCM10010269_69810 [Streptomyces humidus]|uniref:Tetratricopeptide repeat protein n=1 Tax=Streptomyces humidus TaxID=52259 RepID=A0A918G5Y7_9ACTN|nr:hypothetical protein [Streptomyces humidus]GGS20926.1 hypothetical protein GCM10010269_69810 [Streptomyces humidus]